MSRPHDDDDATPYALAPEPPVAVSSASSCSTTLTDEKRRAVKSYINVLGPKLREKYGKKEHYTPEQVRHTIVVSGLDGGYSTDYSCYAYSMYSSPSDFERVHAAAGEVCDYAAMREAVAGAFFGGHADFNTSEVIDAIVSGTAGAVVSGAGHLVGWLGDVNWSGLLDWS
jgi:hypothetical protein